VLSALGQAAIVTTGVQEFRGLAADSREVKPGFLFAALAGTKTDGARFIEDAVKRGAVAILGVPALAGEAKRLGVDFIADANPRLRLAQFAAEFSGAQPACIAAVTGTNGKTSVASFLRQIWAFQGRRAASLGTIGIDSPSGHVSLGHTTPDPVRLHVELARLKREGVDHLAMEASSHGLDQYRLDGVRIACAGFTNITRDHLDYHATFEIYLAAKLRLFTDLVKDGGAAVVNVDAEHADDFVAAARRRGLRLLTVGVSAESLRLAAQTPHAHGQDLTVAHGGHEYRIALPLAGSFQASNALVAAGMAIGVGDPADRVLSALETLKGAPGRLELVARTRDGASIYVDYAHTPDAIVTVLTALRPHVEGRLHVVFGCGGDRDRGKRPLMGEAATRYADVVIVTDDNPRSEDPAAIRREILTAAPGAREIGGRAEAIREAVAALGAKDALVLAGKGHEDYQIVGTKVLPFSDRAEAVKAAREFGGAPVGEAA
jgi:UDP-N-acetylmuramoyl-L-alanyl-D-glutamate--2,6-diaminopimelate ligase